MNSPRVTVITPCFNDGETLAMALASLLAQTMRDWECVVIDDGSPTSIRPIVDGMSDPRIRVHRFSTNRGRPVARQKGLEMARGRWICMLDADDWYYPCKLERQVAAMEAHPELVALATSMAVFDDQGKVRGIRPSQKAPIEFRRGRSHRFPDLAFPSVMLCGRRARQFAFDTRLRRVQDAEYLMRVLAGQPFAVLRDTTYAYREWWSAQSMTQALRALSYQRQIFARQWRGSHLSVWPQYLGACMKTAVYGAAHIARCGQWLFARRNRAPSPMERRRFRRQRRIVRGVLDDQGPRSQQALG